MDADIEISKKSAAEKALEYIRDGMVIGLGTGSTANYFIEFLSRRIQEEGLSIIGIPTSKRTEKLANGLGIKLSNLDHHPRIDLDVDGADQIDPEFNLIKGGGGAHTLEKKVATASKRFIVIADSSKLVNRLERAIPIEVLPSAREVVEQELIKMGGKSVLRRNFTTDGGNLILDTRIEIQNSMNLESALNSIHGVIDNGLFARRRPDMIIIADGKNITIRKR